MLVWRARSSFSYIGASLRVTNRYLYRKLQTTGDVGQLGSWHNKRRPSSRSPPPDGKRVVTASWDNTARVWDAATGAPIGKPLQHEDRVFSASFSPDGKRVVTASDDPASACCHSRLFAAATAPAQIDEAQRMAREWKPRLPPSCPTSMREGAHCDASNVRRGPMSRLGSRAVGRGLPAYGWREAKCAAISGPRSNRNPLDLIERDFVAGAIIELGRARAFVRRHSLRVFERAAGFEIGRDARSRGRCGSRS